MQESHKYIICVPDTNYDSYYCSASFLQHLNIQPIIYLQKGPTASICSGYAIAKFKTTVCSHMTGRLTVIPEDSIVPSILIRGTIVHTVKVCIHNIINIGLSAGVATLNAKRLDTLPAIKYAHRKPIAHSKGKERAA